MAKITEARAAEIDRMLGQALAAISGLPPALYHTYGVTAAAIRLQLEIGKPASNNKNSAVEKPAQESSAD